MQIRKSWWLGLSLAGALLLAGTALAQNQGGGTGGSKVSQESPCCTAGPNGTCVVNPNKQQGNPNGPGTGKAQKRRGMKGPQGGGPGNQPNTPPANPPAAGQ